MWPETPVCPDCGQPTEQIHLPQTARWAPPPIIVFKAPDGSYRFPGDGNGLSAKQYAKQGYECIEIRGAQEMRRFEKTMNKVEHSKAMRQFEQRQEQRSEREKKMRSDLRQQMQTMSELGRNVARAAMESSDRKPTKRPGDANFASEVYSFDRTNRDESRDSQGRRRRD